jgi:preprotein translocase subunit SecD
LIVEGTSLLRIVALVGLVLGSIWVLIPTFVGESAESLNAAAAAQVSAPGGGKQGVDLDVRFDVTSGDAAAIGKVLDARLTAAGVPHTRVEVDGGQLVAKLSAGGRREDVVALAARPGERGVVAPSTLVGAAIPNPGEPDTTQLPPGLADALKGARVDLGVWARRLPEVTGVALPADVQIAAPITAVTTGDSPKATLANPVGEPWGIVAVDRTPVGAVVPAEGEGRLFVADRLSLAVLASGPLGGVVAPVAVEAIPEAASATATVAAEAVDPLPPWLRRLMPDAKINLGLDLQGGIDLTLQVELEDAVQGQVARDTTWLRERAEKQGLVLEKVAHERADPVILITAAAPAADVQAFMRTATRDYEYESSNGNQHAFRMKDARITDVENSAVEQVLETLRKRVDATGVKEPSIAKKGGGRINVQLPGKVDLQQAIDALGTTAVLEFRLVDMEYADSLLEQNIEAAREAMPEAQFLDDELLNEWLWANGRMDEDHIVSWSYSDDETPVRTKALPLKREVVLTGSDINDAGVEWDQNQQPYVSLSFKPHGAQVFCEITSANVGKQFAIVLDDQVSSAPNIREKICGGSAKIDMAASDDPMAEAQTLSLVLRTGSLDAPVVVGEVRNVGAQLGKDSIRQGTLASLIGAGIVMVYMLVWYKVSGFIANVALAANVLMILAALALFGATLTLPGIAGIALTIGMAVDANIIIYERIREELKLGVNARKAVDAGFENATTAILDSNITTAIAGVVLYSYGSGPIRGFAVTLLVGIATTLITALYVSRSLLELATRSSTARLSI